MTAADLTTAGVKTGSAKARRPSQQLGWLVVAAFVVVVGLLLAVHAGRLVELGFAPLAVLVGIFLLFRYERIYIVHVVIMLSFPPFVHRVADNGGTITEKSSILAAPLLVMLISALRLGKLDLFKGKTVVCLFPLLAILYGAVIGVLVGGLKSVAIPLVGWLCPLVIGLFCYVHEDSKQTLARAFTTAISVAGLVVAIYGIIQYFAPPAWDINWLSQLQADGQALSMGTPEAQGIRIFSTCSNPQGAGSLFGFALLITALHHWRFKTLLITILIVALALTSVRSAWVACGLTGFVLLLRASTRDKLKAIPIAAILLLLGGATASTPSGDGVLQRISSFSSVQDDTSYRERQKGRAQVAHIVAHEPFGLGIGYGTSHAKQIQFSATDLGIATMPVELGYLGTIFYGTALVLLLVGPMWKGIRARGEPLALAIGMLFITLLFANTDPLNNALGTFFWVPAGLLLRRFSEDPPAAVRKQRSLGQVTALSTR